MIWATVISWSYFCWLYRASPSLAAKNIINLISVLTICVESSLVLLEEGVYYNQCINRCKTLLAFSLLHFVLLGTNLPVSSGISWLPILHSSPLWWKGHIFWVLVLKEFVGLHKTIQLQLLQRYWLGHRLYNCDIEWFALERNRNNCVIFETASKYCISDSCWLSWLFHFF